MVGDNTGLNCLIMNTKSIINSKNELTITLYHGTSTLFLDSIIKHGLGGFNPVIEWKLIELSQDVLKLSETHLKGTKLFEQSSYSFRQMTQQSNSGSFNWQHGNVYFSPSLFTAAQYAIDKEYGSELLSYIIRFLKELIAFRKSVTVDLYQKYSRIFNLIEAKPSPLLIQATNISIKSLRDEHGNDPDKHLELIEEMMAEPSGLNHPILQQCNFRLTSAIPKSKLDFRLINVQKWSEFRPAYNLYPIIAESIPGHH